MLRRVSMHKQVMYSLSELLCCTLSCADLCATAADVFRLNELPENAKKKLDVSASYFEIYLGKVCELQMYESGCTE